jgi:flavodoxin
VKVAVLYESKTGNTRKAAELIGGAIAALGEDVRVMSVRNVDDLHFLASADLVFVGTWVDGVILFGHRPGGAKALRRMPTLSGKHVAVFNTYAVHQGGMLKKLARMLRRQGATVVASCGFRRTDLQAGLKEFVADALAATPVAA